MTVEKRDIYRSSNVNFALYSTELQEILGTLFSYGINIAEEFLFYFYEAF